LEQQREEHTAGTYSSPWHAAWSGLKLLPRAMAGLIAAGALGYGIGYIRSASYFTVAGIGWATNLLTPLQLLTWSVVPILVIASAAFLATSLAMEGWPSRTRFWSTAIGASVGPLLLLASTWVVDLLFGTSSFDSTAPLVWLMLLMFLLACLGAFLLTRSVYHSPPGSFPAEPFAGILALTLAFLVIPFLGAAMKARRDMDSSTTPLPIVRLGPEEAWHLVAVVGEQLLVADLSADPIVARVVDPDGLDVYGSSLKTREEQER